MVGDPEEKEASSTVPGADSTPRPALPRELVALAQGGCGVAIASCSADGVLRLGFGVGCRVRADGVLRVLAGRRANNALIAAIQSGRPIAVTFTATRDHTSFQVKARRANLVEACSDDYPEMDRQNALFQDGLVEIGFSRLQAAGYSVFEHADLIAIELVPEHIFTQTPGPGAGSELPQ